MNNMLCCSIRKSVKNYISRKYVFFSDICPQHNVLFDNLTAEEHLWFFTILKGNYIEDEINSQVDRMIAAIGLEEKRYF